MGLNDLMHPHANDPDSHGTGGPLRLQDKYAKLFISGKELALPSKREQDYPQNVSSPLQHIFTFQGTKYILRTRRKTLGEWVGVISKVCSGQSFHPEWVESPMRYLRSQTHLICAENISRTL
jgi:hypothetical protein